MDPITLSSFLGVVQAIDEKLLPATVGIASSNQRPGRGDLRPWKFPLLESTVPTSVQRQSLYRMDGGYWFSWTTVVDATKGFDSADTTQRFYFTGSGTPKWTDNVIGLAGGPPYPQAARELAVPAPTTAMTVTQTVAGTADAAEWYYVQTFVNDLGWESGPGPLSALATGGTDATFKVSNLDNAPSGNYGITLTRIYKSVSGTSGTAAFLFMGEYAIGTTNVTDAAISAGPDQLATGANGTGSSWEPPPADGFGLKKLWNGMLAMLSGKTVYICEPFAPYAWPAEYQIDLADNGVALAVYGEQLLALTDGDVYLITGSDPMSMGSTPTKVMAPCVSARSVVEFEDGVVWASTSGLRYYGARGSLNLTEGILDGDQWAALAPSTMKGGRHAEHRLVFQFYDNGTKQGFAIAADSPTSIYPLSTGYDAVHHAATSKMYVLSGGNVLRWDAGGSLMSASFTSKPFQLPAPSRAAALEVVAAAYPVHVKITATDRADNDHTIFDRDVASQDAVRPSPGLWNSLQIAVTTSAGSVQAIRLVEDEEDLRKDG